MRRTSSEKQSRLLLERIARRQALILGHDVNEVRSEKRTALESDPGAWLRHYFAPYVSDDFGQPVPFAEHHEKFWNWLWAIEKGKRPHPFVAIWPRGGAKSTNAEMGTVALGARGIRRYGLYVSGTQDQADDHVQNIADMLEGRAIEEHYPDLAGRRVGKFGNSKGWRRNRLRTASGFTVDAIGLDKAARGAKLEDARPDFIVIDDVDDEADSEHVTEKKIRALTRKILPAGARDLAVLAVQNLVSPDSIFSRLSDGRAGFLSDRIVSGPIPALGDAVFDDTRDEIVSGTPVWEGQSLEICREMAKDMGLEAFLVECQQRVEILTGTIFKPEWWANRNRYANDGSLSNACHARYIFIDTAQKDEEIHDATGFCVIELEPDYHKLAVRESWVEHLQFPDLLEAVEQLAIEYNRDSKLYNIVIEDKVSGTPLMQSLWRQADPRIAPILQPFLPHGSKGHRARQVAPWARRGMILLPDGTSAPEWLYGFEKRLYAFPGGRIKDDVDAFVMGLLFLEDELARGYDLMQAARGMEQEMAV